MTKISRIEQIVVHDLALDFREQNPTIIEGSLQLLIAVVQVHINLQAAS
jgi:hypothetical protein